MAFGRLASSASMGFPDSSCRNRHLLGMLVAGGFRVRPLRIIGAKGEYRASRRERIAELAIVGIVVVPLFWLVGMENTSALKAIRTPIDSLALAIDYLGPAWFGTRGLLFLAWETKNGTHILSEGFPSRLYAVHKNSAC